MIVIDYSCDNCGKKTTNQDAGGFICECGGTFRTSNSCSFLAFRPFYSPETKTYISSQKQMDKVYRKHGLRDFNDSKKLVDKAKFIRKNREEIIKQRYAEKGIKYKPGSKVKFNDKTNSFVPCN